MFLHQSERDAYVMQGIHGEFKNSAYLKTINSRTFDNNDHGLTWKLAELELLAVVEGAKVFVQGTYFLEGDGLIILYTYDFIKHIEQVIHNDHFAVLDEYIETLVSDIEDVNERDIERDILKGHALDVLKPGHAYFARNVLNGDVGANFAMFKAVRLANPAYVNSRFVIGGLEAIKEETNTLSVLKCVDAQMIAAFIAELPAYSQACNDFSDEWLFRAPRPWASLADIKSFKKQNSEIVGLPILNFFKMHSVSFPTWALLAEEIFILSPSSAAVERVFSLLRDKFDSQSIQCLIDYITASLLLCANKRELPV